jgi:hypothetical protein
VFKFDAWVVPFSMIKTGKVRYTGVDGKLMTVPVNRDASFTRQG